MGTTFTIAKREFRSYFDSPVAYVATCVFLLALGFLFFFVDPTFWQRDRASMQNLMEWIPRGFILLVPIITMHLMAEERRSGTLEMLITLPVKDHQIILGKFLGAWAVVVLIIISTMLFPLMMFEFPWHLGPLDAGPLQSAYLGILLHSAAAVSIGLLISSLTDSQIIAALLSIATLIILHVIHGAVGQLGSVPEVKLVAQFIGFEARLQPFTRGMINSRDVIYFLSITIICLMASFRALERRKWA